MSFCLLPVPVPPALGQRALEERDGMGEPPGGQALCPHCKFLVPTCFRVRELEKEEERDCNVTDLPRRHYSWEPRRGQRRPSAEGLEEDKADLRGVCGTKGAA